MDGLTLDEIEPEMCFHTDYFGGDCWIAKMVEESYEVAGVGRTEAEALADWRGKQSLADWSRV